MARIRAIKPGFFRDTDLFDAEREEGLPLRVAYAGLWTAADREGRFAWDPRTLKLDCLPHDDVDFAEVLDAFWKHGFIIKFEVAGKVYGAIPTWLEHQIVNNREVASVIPEPDDTNTLTREARVDDASGTRGQSRRGEQEREQERELERNGTVRATRETRRSRFSDFWEVFPKRDGSNPKEPSRKLFDSAVKSGEDPELIIGGAKRYHEECRRKVLLRTDKVAQALTWLRQKRWMDYPEGAIAEGGEEGRWANMLKAERDRGSWPFEKEPKSAIPPEFIARWEAANPAGIVVAFPGAQA